MTITFPASVEEAINGGPTPPIRDFLEAMDQDDNVRFRLGQHMSNLAEEAIEMLVEINELVEGNTTYTADQIRRIIGGRL